MTQLLKDIRVRIAVIDSSDPKVRKPDRFISKNAARCLVRRQTYSFVDETTIKRCQSHIGQRPHRPRFRGTAKYEHHVEPKLEPMTIANSAYQRYLQGFAYDARLAR